MLRNLTLTVASLMFLVVTPLVNAEPVSPHDDALVSSINALNGRASNDTTLLQSIHEQIKQRRSYLKSDNASAQGLAQSKLSSGEWLGDISGIIIDYTNENDEFIEPGTEFYIHNSQGRVRVFALTQTLEALFYKGAHVRIKGFIYKGRVIAEEGVEVDELGAALANDVAASGADTSATTVFTSPGCETTGPSQAWVVPINYLDNPTASPSREVLHERYFGATGSLAEYWNEASYGRMTLTGETAEWSSMDANNACDIYSSFTNALGIASTNQVNLDNVNKIFMVMPSPPGGCGFAGVGYIGCARPVMKSDGTTHRVAAHLNIASYMSSIKGGVGLAAHEAGHNLGLDHATTEENGTDALVGVGSAGLASEYGDMFDTMGGNWSLIPGHYNAIHKTVIGWLKEGEFIPTHNATHTIEPMSTPLTGPKALRIFRGLAKAPYLGGELRDMKEYLWVETRTGSGYDSYIDNQVYGGALVHLQRRFIDFPDYVSNIKTALIDTTPQSTTSTERNADFLDAAIQPGGSFYDPYGGITIHHLGIDTMGNVTAQVFIDADKLDSDEDGFTDSIEVAQGTDPNAEDGDADGYTDWQEVCYDEDCTTYEPYPNGGDLNATNADTDNDGLLDAAEDGAGTDPLHPDTDHDGFIDDVDSSPSNIFLPNPEGMNLTNDVRFAQPTTSYTSSDSLNIKVWNKVVGTGASKPSFTVTGGETVITLPLDDLGNGSYSGHMLLSQLNYTGTDIEVSAYIHLKKIKYTPIQTISISGTGTVPDVTITSLIDGLLFESGSSISSSASSNDTEDGNLTAELLWTSNLDGTIGNGADFTTVLSDGAHLITASSADSDGNIGRAEINIEVGLFPIKLTGTRTGSRSKGVFDNLSWYGATSRLSDIYRDGVIIDTARNIKNDVTTYSLSTDYRRRFEYQVCESGTQICSAVITLPAY